MAVTTTIQGSRLHPSNNNNNGSIIIDHYEHKHPLRRSFHPKINNRVWPPPPILPTTTNPPTTTVAPSTATTTNPPSSSSSSSSPTTLTPTTLPPTLTPGPLISPSLVYHDGPLIQSNSPLVYTIYYGNWSTLDPGTPPLINTFIDGLSGSYLWNILTTYYDDGGGGGGSSPKRYLPNSLVHAGSLNVTTYPYGKNLTDNSIYSIVQDAIPHFPAPINYNSIYVVLTSPDVDETSGFCTSYCGWHTYNVFNTGSGIQQQYAAYAYIGSSNRCEGCLAAYDLGSPNNNPNADAMVSILLHELAESMTDPFFVGWYNSDNDNEMADVCEWQYGLVYNTTTSTADGSPYANVYLGGKNWLVQMLAINTVSNSQYCANLLY